MAVSLGCTGIFMGSLARKDDMGLRRKALFGFLLVFSAVVADLLSCGGQSGKGGRSPEGTMAGDRASSADSVDVTLSLNAGSYALGEMIVVRLVATNRTERALRLNFPTAQRFDFVVRKGKQIIWQWSGDMMFAEAVSRETVAAHDSLVFEARWDQRLFDGTNPGLGAYSIQGILKTRPEVVSKERPFGVVD